MTTARDFVRHVRGEFAGCRINSATALGSVLSTLRELAFSDREQIAVRRAHAALKVITTDERIRTFLLEADPQALKQAEQALE